MHEVELEEEQLQLEIAARRADLAASINELGAVARERLDVKARMRELSARAIRAVRENPRPYLIAGGVFALLSVVGLAWRAKRRASVRSIEVRLLP